MRLRDYDIEKKPNAHSDNSIHLSFKYKNAKTTEKLLRGQRWPSTSDDIHCYWSILYWVTRCWASPHRFWITLQYGS